ncbi:MAG: hypothetical protein BMS9Abin28_2499 [Anaerolineae bacterium]|nr:MAG: hypothetical protein BMS9Abin28_2499 [Anaerolineae bacterium]
MTFSAIFAILVGAAMIGQWTASYVTEQIQELQSEPLRIWFHIAGEIVTAVSLIVGGIGLLTVQPWAPALFLVSMGMLLYTAIVSPGYFAQKGQWIWVLIFGVLIALAIIAILAVSSSVNCSPDCVKSPSNPWMIDFSPHRTA